MYLQEKEHWQVQESWRPWAHSAWPGSQHVSGSWGNCLEPRPTSKEMSQQHHPSDPIPPTISSPASQVLHQDSCHSGHLEAGRTRHRDTSGWKKDPIHGCSKKKISKVSSEGEVPGKCSHFPNFQFLAHFPPKPMLFATAYPLPGRPR